MTGLQSFLARGSVLAMVVLRTCHGFYMPGVRPYEFAPNEEVPMKVNALTSIHTQVRPRLVLADSIDVIGNFT
jgi:transmembrane 9 superfamily protein 2/4